MIKAEFGMIDEIDPKKDYSAYEPQNYHCIAIDDDLYLNDWWPKLLLMQTYFHSLDHPSQALARHGVTLIPPQSLPAFQEIVLSDRRINQDDQLVDLALKIQAAIDNQKFMIHYGV